MKKTLDALKLWGDAVTTVPHGFFVGTLNELQVLVNETKQTYPLVFVDITRVTEADVFAQTPQLVRSSAQVAVLVQASENDTPASAVVAAVEATALIVGLIDARTSLKALPKTLNISQKSYYEKATLENVAGISFTISWDSQALC